MITEGHGVSDDDSEDDGDPLAIKDPLSVAAVLPDSDPVSQLAKLPIAPAALVPKSIVNGMVLPGTTPLPGSKAAAAANNVQTTAAGAASSAASNTPVNDDFLDDIALAPEDNYTDWNYSIKFFTFFRGVPDKNTKISSHEPVPVSNKSPIVLPQQLTKEPTPIRIHPNHVKGATTAPAKVAAEPPQKTVNAPAANRGRGGARGTAATARGGRGSRGGGRGGGTKRAKPADDDDESADDASSADSEDRAPRKKPRGGGGRGRGRGRGAAARGAAARGGAAKSSGGSAQKNKSRYRDSSEEEESSESEGEVLSRPVVTKSGRPSRNCRQSTNYAEIEGASDVLDYLLEHR